MGMTPAEYWDGDPWLFSAYREAERIAREKRAWDRWSMGLYVYDAIGRLVPVLNPFSKKHKAEPFPERPYEVSGDEEAEKTPVELEKEAHDRTKAWVMSLTVGGSE